MDNNPLNATNPIGAQTPPASVLPQPINISGQPASVPMSEPAAPPPSSGLPPVMPSSPQVSKTGGGGNMLMIVGIILLILVILGVGGFIFYQSMGTPKTEDTGLSDEIAALEKEAANLEISDPETDLEQIDNDIVALDATPSAE